MNRRELLVGSTALAGLAMTTKIAFADNTVLDVYTNSDANISDFFNNVINPAFMKADPGMSINMVIARAGGALDAIASRALAALGTNSDPKVDMIEQYDPHLPNGAMEKGLWLDWTSAGLTNYSKVNKMAIQTKYGLPYRGSQVLLAYDTTKLPKDKVPKTWDDLVAWMKANPGQFIYNRPDKGGAGGNFVRRAIHQVNGLDPSKFTLDNYSDDYAKQTLTPAWDLLNSIAPYMYNKGAYTSGNTQSLQLLAQGAVTMVPAWSDQSLQAISQEVLPNTTGLVQLQDLALCGGFSTAVVPTDAAHKDAAIKLADFLLSEEIQTQIVSKLGGFPGVDWSNLPSDLQQKYADVVPKSIPTFPGGKWGEAISDGWYRNVAPNIDRNS